MSTNQMLLKQVSGPKEIGRYEYNIINDNSGPATSQ